MHAFIITQYMNTICRPTYFTYLAHVKPTSEQKCEKKSLIDKAIFYSNHFLKLYPKQANEILYKHSLYNIL